METTPPLTRLIVTTQKDREPRSARLPATSADRTESLYSLVNLGGMPALQLSPAEAIRLSLESNYANERSMDDPVKAAGQEIDSPCSKLEDTDNHDSAHNDLDNDPECARDGSCNA